MDPDFDPVRFLAIAKDLFVRLQIGWSGGDLAAVRAHLTDEMAVALEGDMARLRERGRRNRVDQVAVDSVALTEAWQEHGRDLVTAEIRAGAMDYVVDEATGQVVEGSATQADTVRRVLDVRPAGGPEPLEARSDPAALGLTAGGAPFGGGSPRTPRPCYAFIQAMAQVGVLLVDPDQTLVGGIRQALEGHPYELRLAGSGSRPGDDRDG